MLSFMFASLWQGDVEESLFRDECNDSALGDDLYTVASSDCSSVDGSGISAIALDPEEDLSTKCSSITTRHVRFQEEKETFACPYERVHARELWYSKQDYAVFREAVQSAAGQKRALPWFQSLKLAHKQLKDTRNNRQIQWILRNGDVERPVTPLALGLEQAALNEERTRCRRRLARKINQCQQRKSTKDSRERQIRKACLALSRPSRLLAQYTGRRVAVSVQRDSRAWRQFSFLDASSA